jgi:hypothetical protein
MKTALCAALLALCITACGSSSSSDTGGGTTGMGFTAAQLCALATSAQVGAAIGRSVPAGVPSGVNAPSCTWTASDGGGATIAATEPASVGKIPFGLQGKSGAHVTAIPSLGDAAYYADAGGDFPEGELDMKKGARAVTITASWSGVTLAQQEAGELAIAEAAVTHM